MSDTGHIHHSYPSHPVYYIVVLSPCVPLREKLWDIPIRLRRDRTKQGLSSLPHGAPDPFFSLGLGLLLVAWGDGRLINPSPKRKKGVGRGNALNQARPEGLVGLSVARDATGAGSVTGIARESPALATYSVDNLVQSLQASPARA
eukprot:9504056-Pyramimonas_sp.AAC.2